MVIFARPRDRQPVQDGHGRVPVTRGKDWRTAVRRAASAGAEPLDRRIHQTLEPNATSVDFDLSRVRVHSNEAAHEAAELLSARAFTIGTHVFFGSGAYQPATASGLRMLRHELTHVLQSPKANLSAVDSLPLTGPESQTEKEASAAATATGRLAAPPSEKPPAIRRVLAAYSSPQSEILPSLSAGGSSGPWVLGVRRSEDVARLRGALAALIAAKKIEVASRGDRDFFSLPMAGAVTLAEVTSALTTAGFPRADAMAKALVDRHNAWIFVGEEVREMSAIWTMEIGRDQNVLRQTDRPLTSEEQSEAQLAFGGGLDYSKIRITEDPVLGSGGIARALPSTIYFPPGASKSAGYMPWLIHELTHSWQYQHGIGIPRTAATAFLCYAGVMTYSYGGEPALIAAKAAGKGFRSFNTEQQGDIVRDYYKALKAGRGLAAWAGLLPDIQSPP
ncbi:eCIS core domain-containing protein [Streptomyces sp. NPDC000888]